jgi:DNA polymerase-3 subunit delta
MRKLGSEPLPPVLLFGPGKAAFGRDVHFEPVLAEQAIERIVDAMVDPSMRDMAYTVFYGDEVQPGAIVLEANTLPFLVEQRVILVRNTERYLLMGGEKNSALAPLAEYIQSPNPSTVLLMVCSKADKRKKFWKVCEDAGAVVECPPLEQAEMSQWIRNEAERRGKKLSNQAIHELMDRAGVRLGDVSNALDLVCNYAGAKTDISDVDVRTACSDVAEETVWALTDAIAASNTSKALHTLHQLLALGKAPDEILGLINWLLETAYRAAPDSRLQVKSAFQAKKVMPLVEKLGFAKLKDALALCTDTHFMIRSTGVDQMLALELLVIKLSYARPQQQRRPVRG